jgi:hypothetical protein
MTGMFIGSGRRSSSPALFITLSCLSAAPWLGACKQQSRAAEHTSTGTRSAAEQQHLPELGGQTAGDVFLAESSVAALSGFITPSCGLLHA